VEEKMTCEAHILSFCEEELIAYTVRHYKTFCSRVVVHDAYSVDRTREVAKKAGAEVAVWDTNREFNDTLAVNLKNSCWRGTKADWVVVADCDELIYFPLGAETTLAAYDRLGFAIVKPYGFEMMSETMPTGTGQIYDEIKYGARDDKWHAKPILFRPKFISVMDYGCGAHDCKGVLQSGQPFQNPTTFSLPSTLLLHFHQIGPPSRTAARYDAALARQSQENLLRGYGNRTVGAIHAKEKRDFIKANLQRVIP
jgi:glycosyltransferase involved in cell wall biosynthesis